MANISHITRIYTSSCIVQSHSFLHHGRLRKSKFHPKLPGNLVECTFPPTTATRSSSFLPLSSAFHHSLHSSSLANSVSVTMATCHQWGQATKEQRLSSLLVLRFSLSWKFCSILRLPLRRMLVDSSGHSAGLKINGMWGEDESWEDKMQSLSPVCAGHEIYLSVLCCEASVHQHLESAFLQLSADHSNCCPQSSSHLLTAFLGYKVL